MSSGIRQLRTEPLSPLPPLPSCSPRTDHSLKRGESAPHGALSSPTASVLRGGEFDTTRYVQPVWSPDGAFAWPGGGKRGY